MISFLLLNEQNLNIMKRGNKSTEHKNTDKKLIISDVRERLINYIDTQINYFSGGDEMKSMNESIRDEIFVKELEKMKKVINDNKF